ncbi:hypothetical protein AB7074_19925, partial [Klebsiella pneumoniae]
KRAYCLKTQPATGETYPKSDLFNKAMTVYKPITTLATNAAEIAVELGNDKQPKADTTLNNGLKDVPSRLLTPIEVNKENIDATVIKDGFHKKSEL